MDHFNALPDEMIVNIFRYHLMLTSKRLNKYSQLHLVCRRWHSICVSWAEHLPKQKESICIYFEKYRSEDVILLIRLSGKYKRSPLRELKFSVLLRHFDTTDISDMKFQFLNCTDEILQIVLESELLTAVSHLSFDDCNLIGLTEEVLTSFFAAIASEKCCTKLSFNCVKPTEAITDQSLGPIIGSRILENFLLLSSSRAFKFNITDETLITLSWNLPNSSFNYNFVGSNKITADGVHRFIQTFCSGECSVEESSDLWIPSTLKTELLKLMPGHSRKSRENTQNRMVFHRLSSHPFPKALLLLHFEI